MPSVGQQTTSKQGKVGSGVGSGEDHITDPLLEKPGLEPGATHLTVEGDTYWGMSQQYGVSVEELRSWNLYPDTGIPIDVEINLTPYSTAGASGAVGTGDDFSTGAEDGSDDVATIVKLREWSDEALIWLFAQQMVFYGGDQGAAMATQFFTGEGAMLEHESGSSLSALMKDTGEYETFHEGVRELILGQMATLMKKTTDPVELQNSLDLSDLPNIYFSDVESLIGNMKLAIAIGGTQKREVLVSNMKVTGPIYNMDIQYNIYDDFGVDVEDVKKYADSSLSLLTKLDEALAAMWILQHERSKGKPFINKVIMTDKVSGIALPD